MKKTTLPHIEPLHPWRAGAPFHGDGWVAMVLLTVMLGITGCAGFAGSRFDWIRANPPDLPKTKTDVVARFGEPIRKTKEAGQEVWQYLLPDRAETERSTRVGLIFLIWWTTQADENVRVRFFGDEVTSVDMLTVTETGAVCGVFISMHGPSVGYS